MTANAPWLLTIGFLAFGLLLLALMILAVQSMVVARRGLRVSDLGGDPTTGPLESEDQEGSDGDEDIAPLSSFPSSSENSFASSGDRFPGA